MDIDFSLPTYSKWTLWIDSQFRYGYRHLYAAGFNVGIKVITKEALFPIAETVYHVTLGLFELIPLVGLLISTADKFFNEKKLRIIHLEGNDPYQLGLDQGRKLKKEIQFSVKKVMKIFEFVTKFSFPGRNLLKEALEAENFILPEYILEMKGIAEGAGVSYEEILLENTILDKIYGCSLLSICDDPKTKSTSKQIATNYYPSDSRARVPNVDNSFKRYDSLAKETSTEIEDLKNALLKVNYYDTVHALIFDSNTRDIHMAVASSYAANRSYTHIKGEDLFGPKLTKFEKTVKLARTLDWPLELLSSLFMVFKRDSMGKSKSTAIVGLPGMVGAISGINEDGLALAISVVPYGRVARATPNGFIFRQILESADTALKAEDIVKESSPSSAMNLVVAAKDGVSLMEIHPERRKIERKPEEQSSLKKVANWLKVNFFNKLTFANSSL